MITLREALTRATDQLSANPQLRPTALADAALLLMEALAIDRATLIAHPERKLDREAQAKYQAFIARRLTFEPIQYILGRQEFFGLNLRVTPAVLIPRPETELLVEAVLQQMPSARRIADIGTGSGAIAVALARSLPDSHVVAIDLSEAALNIARENAAALTVTNITFVESDLLATVADEPPFDVIVSNPPYVPLSDASALHPQVREHEPATALFAGATGLDVYARLIPQAFALLVPGGLLALEIGHGQRAAIVALLHDFNEVTFLDDLQGIPRVALARKPRS